MGVNGTFSYQISDVEHFFKDIVGARTEVSNSEIRDLILGRLSQNIVTTIHKLGYSYNQIDGHLTEIGQELATLLNEETQKLGFTLTDFRVDGTLFDEQTQERIGRIADVTADSQAAQADLPTPNWKNYVPCAMPHVTKAAFRAVACRWALVLRWANKWEPPPN